MSKPLSLAQHFYLSGCSQTKEVNTPSPKPSTAAPVEPSPVTQKEDVENMNQATEKVVPQKSAETEKKPVEENSEPVEQKKQKQNTPKEQKQSPALSMNIYQYSALFCPTDAEYSVVEFPIREHPLVEEKKEECVGKEVHEEKKEVIVEKEVMEEKEEVEDAVIPKKHSFEEDFPIIGSIVSSDISPMFSKKSFAEVAKSAKVVEPIVPAPKKVVKPASPETVVEPKVEAKEITPASTEKKSEKKASISKTEKAVTEEKKKGRKASQWTTVPGRAPQPKEQEQKKKAAPPQITKKERVEKQQAAEKAAKKSAEPQQVKKPKKKVVKNNAKTKSQVERENERVINEIEGPPSLLSFGGVASMVSSVVSWFAPPAEQ